MVQVVKCKVKDCIEHRSVVAAGNLLHLRLQDLILGKGLSDTYLEGLDASQCLILLAGPDHFKSLGCVLGI